MKQSFQLKLALVLVFILLVYPGISQSFTEQPLWPNGIDNNPIKYPKEKFGNHNADASSLAQMNRSFTSVSNPVYVLVKPEKPNGVGIVICPGGGFKEIWFDREGTDIALYLAKFGITSMVLKYRTYNPNEEGMNMGFIDYAFHAYADTKQAINILHEQAKDLGLHKNKIGIMGFSAGGSLALGSAISIGDVNLPVYASSLKGKTLPDFACLIYPGIDPSFIKAINKTSDIPPVFLINDLEDVKTPVTTCVELFTELQKNGVKTELHIYAKGTHGFGSGLERGYGVSGWRDSFIAWLRDMEFMK
jgi:acetyl esterase/lipase